MAIALTPPAHYLRGTTVGSVPNGNTLTWCCWFLLNDQPGGSLQFNTVIAQDNGPNNWMGVYLGATSGGNTRIEFWADNTAGGTSARIVSPNIDYGEWYFVAVTRSTNSWNLYWRRHDAGTLSSASATFSVTLGTTSLQWGKESAIDAATTLDGSIAHCRLFQSTLDSTQLLSESSSTTAVATPWGDWPLENTSNHTTDISGNSRTLTANAGAGAFSNTTGPLDGGAVEVVGSASGTWGPWAGTATGSVSESVTEGLASATWGPMNGFASGQVTEAVTAGTAAATWGGWSGTAAGQVITDITAGTATATWGPWAGTATGEVTETRVDVTVNVGPTRGRRGLIGSTAGRRGTVGPTRIDRGP